MALVEPGAGNVDSANASSTGWYLVGLPQMHVEVELVLVLLVAVLASEPLLNGMYQHV